MCIYLYLYTAYTSIDQPKTKRTFGLSRLPSGFKPAAAEIGTRRMAAQIPL